MRRSERPAPVSLRAIRATDSNFKQRHHHAQPGWVTGASWFETRGVAALLTMRVYNLILRRRKAPSRRMRPPRALADRTPRSRRRFCARFAVNLRSLKSEGAGMPGARCARSRACRVENTRVSHHGHTGNARHSPRNGFNGFLRALPGDRALLPPSPAALAASLTPASGRQDHTTSPSASAPFVKGASASTASRAALMTLRNAPLWLETARVVMMICPTC